MREPSKKVIPVHLPEEMVNALDQCILNERKGGGEYVSRSAAIEAIIESADVPNVIATLARRDK